jgi:DNA-binding CsgD family transcriptional regulator/tetratricopeptide (TPR) repeat protein
MQPIRPNDGADVLTSDPVLTVARDAWFRGDFAACLDALARCAPPNDAERREAVLLRCRALLRLQRTAEIVEVLGPMLRTFVAVDEACTARMLHATAVARSQDAEKGLALLYDVATSARILDAHSAVRAEIQYRIAYVHWLKREYDAVLEHAVVAEEARADVISVRAATLRGFVALAKERYHHALKLFRWAFEAYRSCRERDADLAEQIVVQIAALEVALQSAEVQGTHTLPPEVGTRLPDEPAPRIPGVSRMQIASLDSWLYAFDGDRDKAYERARVADRLAPSPAWLTWSLANRAQIAAAFGDLACARSFAADAAEIADTVDWNATADEERVGLLLLAEVLAITNEHVAVMILERYDALTSTIDRSRLFHDDVRLWILETFVRGLVFRIQGDFEQAWESFKGVHTAAQRVTVLWRSALALIELDSTPHASRTRGDQYLQTAALIVRKNFPRSFIARRLGRWMNVYRDPIASRLAPQPRAVLRHFLAAKSAKEVAALLGLSEHTVKDYTETLFRAFNVHSKEELLVACYERGIGSPSWWSTLDEANPPPIAEERSAPKQRATPDRRRRRRSA